MLLTSTLLAQEITYESEVHRVAHSGVEVDIEVGVLNEKPVSIKISFTNLSGESRTLSIPANEVEMAKAIYIRHNGLYLKEYWRLNQIMAYGAHGEQLRLRTQSLQPEESVSWTFSIPDIVDDAASYNALESYRRLRISFSFPMTVSEADGSVLSDDALTIRWVNN